MQPAEAPEGLAAQLVYLGGMTLAGVTAWVFNYMRGHTKEDNVLARQVILEGAELADMQAVRDVIPLLHKIVERQELFAQRIVTLTQVAESTAQMLGILQKLEAKQRAEDEAAERRQFVMEELRRQDHERRAAEWRDGHDPARDRR